MNTILPVRCYTCGKVLGNLGDRYDKLLDEGMSTEDALDELGLIRYCCRMNVFNPIVLPKVGLDPATAFMDTTIPSSSILREPKAPTGASKINLAYHTIEPDELKLPKAGPAKPTKVQEDIFLEDVEAPRPPPPEEDEDLPPVRRVPTGLPTGGPPKKILLAR
jgi:DNA-directed RNA polymerase I, II, and III subunit RPABC5